MVFDVVRKGIRARRVHGLRVPLIGQGRLDGISGHLLPSLPGLRLAGAG